MEPEIRISNKSYASPEARYTLTFVVEPLHYAVRLRF